MTFFDLVVEQLGGRAAFAAALGNQHLHGHVPAEAAQSLLSWADLADVITTRRLVPPDLQVYDGGKAVNPREYLDRDSSPRRKKAPVVDPDRLRELLHRGTTLVINGMDELHAPVRDSAYALSAVVGEEIQTHMYATWGQTQAFAAHWDVVDVLVVQVEGEKQWDVFGPGTPAPLDATTNPDNECPADPVWSGRLRPGDLLYLPRGWWHRVRGTGEVSVHLSYGFQRRTGLAYLSWLSALAKHQLPLRVDLPVGGSAEDLAQHQKAVAECLAQLMADHPLAEYVQLTTKSGAPSPLRLHQG